MALLSAKFLGQFQVTLDGAPVHGWRYDKVRALLAYLMLEANRPHTRDQLAALLWPDSPDAAARKSLRQALTHLRVAIDDKSAVPPFLLITRESIQFNPASRYELDAAVFWAIIDACDSHPHQHVQRCPACTERLAQAAALYQGDLWAGFSLPSSLPFEEWLSGARERLRLDAIDALGHLAAAYAHSRNDDAAIQTARRQLALDPWHEDAYRLLMRLLAQRGQRTAALAEYERCRRVLAEELGIEPSQETTTLYEQIRRETGGLGKQQEVETAVAAGRDEIATLIPTPLTALIGRDGDVTAVTDLLRRDGVRLLTLLGPPGIGKTRLALQVGQAMQADFQGNIFFVDLTAINDPALAPVAIARSLGFSVGRKKAAPLTRLARELQNKRALLILDNFEQVLEAATAVLDLLHACSQLKILVTSRAPLRLRGEQRYLLAPLPLPSFPHLPELADLMQNPAVALFVTRAQAVMPTFTLTSENAAAIAAICARVDGLPLAIELAAARVRLLPPPLLLRRLQDATGGALRLLQDGARGATQQHQTLQGAIGWSHNLLPENIKLIFARLGVFANGFSLEAAEAICQVGHISLHVLAGIETLLDQSLIQQIEISQNDYRFIMMQTIREFALEQLAERGESALLQQHHADYFVTFAKMAEEELPGKQHDEWLNRIEQEMDNLRSALTWTIAQSPEQGLELAVALFPFWHSRAYLQEGRLWLERALASANANTPTRARALAAASLMAQRLGDYEPAAAWAEASVALSRQLGDQAALAYALNNLSIVLMSQGDNTAAKQVSQESLELCEALSDQVGIHRALMVLGQVALHEDRLNTARHALENSLSFWRQHGDRKNAVLCLVNLARMYMMRGEYAVVASNIEEAVRLSRQLGDRHWELMASWTLGEVALRQGEYDQAAARWRACLVQARELGDRYFTAITLSKMGLLSLYIQDFVAAEGFLQESLDLARTIGSRWCLADVFANLGFAASLGQDFSQAETLLQESLRLFVAQGEWADAVFVLERLVQVLAALEKSAQAAMLLGATTAWRLLTGEPLPPNNVAEHEQTMGILRQQLGETAFSSAWVAGQEMSVQQAVEIGLGENGLWINGRQ